MFIYFHYSNSELKSVEGVTQPDLQIILKDFKVL